MAAPELGLEGILVVNVVELEEMLSRPTPAVVDALARLDGDLVVLGAAGKMGPSLARMARRALDAAGIEHSVAAVARFSRPVVREELEAAGVRTIVCDLGDAEAVARLPNAAGVVFMAGAKFGTADRPFVTWALNAWLPGVVADRYRGVPTVVFSSGNVYPFVSVDGRGADERTTPAPIGEYGWSVLARERIFEHFAAEHGTPTTIFRLNYASELRYGVPVDIAKKVHGGKSIDLSMGHFNVIWQGDANAIALASLGACATPATILNVTGPEVVRVRDVATRFAERFETEAVFDGTEQPTALLSDASIALDRFGPQSVGLDQLLEWVADWVQEGGESLDKPTHYDVRDGVF